jgi:hypothetical protein
MIKLPGLRAPLNRGHFWAALDLVRRSRSTVDLQLTLERPSPDFRARMQDRRQRWYVSPPLLARIDDSEWRSFRAGLVNKITMYPYVDSLGLALPQRYFEVGSVGEIDFGGLPDRLVIKPNNSASNDCVLLLAGGVELLSGDQVSDRRAYVTERFATGKYTNAATRIIGEELVTDYDPAHPIPRDFKVFVAGGESHYIQVVDRNPVCSTCRFYTRDWRPIEDPVNTYNPQGPPIPQPPHFQALLEAANKIARDLQCFYRLDFFMSTNGPIFGEFTSYPLAGLHYTPRGDQMMCQLLDMNPDRL